MAAVSRFKLVFFTPTKDTSRILNHIFTKFPQNVGKVGQYESCAFVTRGTGQFRPGSEANPVIGTRGDLEYVEEDRVEVVVSSAEGHDVLKATIKELKNVSAIVYLVILKSNSTKVHPYEEVAYDVYRLEDL